MEIVIGLVILYVIQAVLIYGMTFGHFQGKWPSLASESYLDDRIVAVCMGLTAGLLPLVGLILIFVLSEGAKYGIRFK